MGEKSATPQARFIGLRALGTAHRLNAEWSDTLRVLQEVVDAAAGGNNRMVEGMVRAELSDAFLGLGDLVQAEVEAQLAITVSRAQHSRCDEVRGCLALANVLLRCADAPALARIDEALTSAQALIDETGALAFQAEVHECRGRLALLRADASSAKQAFDDALKSYTEMGAPLQVARLQREMGA
jgi:hypothetical protein